MRQIYATEKTSFINVLIFGSYLLKLARAGSETQAASHWPPGLIFFTQHLIEYVHLNAGFPGQRQVPASSTAWGFVLPQQIV
jgi:hypothetical protein